MTSIATAIKSRVPFVWVKTDDLVHVNAVLTWIANGEDIMTFKPVAGSDTQVKPNAVYLTNADEAATAKNWVMFKNANSTLVFVNTKKHVLYLDCGVLFPPKDMMVANLQSWCAVLKQESVNADLLVSAYGGLTLKEAWEVTKMAVQEFGTLIPKHVNKVRQALASKAKGITQVEIDQEFYQCPFDLDAWMNLNAGFFLEPPHPSLMPRGLLFDGPPGTGKTAAAKYIAQMFGLPLFRLDIAGMKGKYVGDSEGALQTALTQIDQAAPCVVIMDEVEKVFQENGDKGVTSSMLSQLLWWLQEHKTQVFTVMTTNSKVTIPKELFREGRIDSVLTFQGLETHEELMTFGTTVYERMAAQVGLKPQKGDLAEILNALHEECANGPVPQSRAIERVHTLIKTKLNAKKEA